ncbi:hypothetical protein HHK36_018370 [Tetracentron sinense]|uniref:C2H2-type domain-containing protein n=1 Tax=Tetracentron sinense TaxID=13715 RepID=A0A834YYE2_TETSI|nr:hypothetical protein HHK36_018370 [Tetracentron sinense]
MKRSRGDGENESLTMAACLMLLSRGGYIDSVSQSPSRVFECKTCNRQFSSFQALGGHRASHKRPRLRLVGGDPYTPTQLRSLPVKAKTHECSICGLEFAIGQALGGHMRRHRATMSEAKGRLSPSPPSPPPPTSQDLVVKKSISMRVFCMDLNLTPLENGLEFQFEKVASMVN